MKFIHSLLFITSLGGVASAATIVQTASYSFVPNGSQTLTFNKFNTALGTLTSVTVSVVLNKTGGSFQIDNDSATAGTIDLTHSVTGSLSSTVSLLNTSLVAIGTSGSLTASSSLTGQSIAATTGDSVSTFNSTGLGDNVVFNPENSSDSDTGTIFSFVQAQYEGTGTYTTTVNALQTVGVTGVSGLQQAFTVSSVSGDVVVTYNYTAVVPEPASALLGGLGFLAILRRRRY
jgi:hypothetical protein